MSLGIPNLFRGIWLTGVLLVCLGLFWLLTPPLESPPIVPPKHRKNTTARFFPLSDLKASISTVTKREFWEKLRPGFICPPHLFRKTNQWNLTLKFGNINKPLNDYALCGSHAQLPHCIVYSFGVERDSAFEADLVTTTNCTVFAYDPTVPHMGRPLGLKATLNHPRLHFKKVGIGGKDETRKGLVYRTLKTLMRDNGGHKWIDILKIVEGAEVPGLVRAIEDWGAEEGLPFGLLDIEIHPFVWQWERAKVVEFLQRLEDNGLRLFDLEMLPTPVHKYGVAELAFINVKKLDKIPGLENYSQ